MSEIAIGIDLGGTRIKAVAIDEFGSILHEYNEATNDGDDSIWKTAIAKAVDDIQNKFPDNNAFVGISAPGLPNADNTAIAFMPGRLQGLENFDWSDFLETPSYVLNDAISAMMAEARYGVARDRKNVAMVTLGTGVGGALLIEGKPYQGAFSKAGHLGHMVIDSEGEPDIIGMPGSLEDAIGNCSIKKRTNGKYTSTHQLIEDYRKGNSYAREIWLTSLNKLAIGLASLTNILSPEMIIVGGGISDAGKDLFEPLAEMMGKYEWRTAGNKAEIVKSQYGDLSGAVGSACFAREAAKN